MHRLLYLIAIGMLCADALSYPFDRRWARTHADETRDAAPDRQKATSRAASSNLGCFLCTQLLAVTKHRVGLSQSQLRNVLYEKCRVLPQVAREQCFTFVDRSLPEIYFSLNYDFSSKNVCVSLNLCDEGSPFAIATPPPTVAPAQPAAPFATQPPINERQPPLDAETTPRVVVTTTTTTTPATTTETPERPTPLITTPPPTIRQILPLAPQPPPPYERVRGRGVEPNETISDRIGHKNEEREKAEHRRVTCRFCERMLENAKQYAVTAKSDITSFANNACAQMNKGRNQDVCYELADKKIDELAKFVDHQVIEALWCAELNQC